MTDLTKDQALFYDSLIKCGGKIRRAVSYAYDHYNLNAMFYEDQADWYIALDYYRANIGDTCD